MVDFQEILDSLDSVEQSTSKQCFLCAKKETLTIFTYGKSSRKYLGNDFQIAFKDVHSTIST